MCVQFQHPHAHVQLVRQAEELIVGTDERPPLLHRYAQESAVALWKSSKVAGGEIAAHQPLNPLEVLLKCLIQVAIAVGDCDAAVVCPQQSGQAQRQPP